jgi:hypothetical protein
VKFIFTSIVILTTFLYFEIIQPNAQALNGTS